MGFGGSGGGGGAIAGATDVAISNPSNNNVLAYDSSIAKWKNATATGGSSTVASSDITDATTLGRAVLTAADANTAKTSLGLQNVNNTSDASKPISTATQTALDTKADSSTAQVIIRYNTATNSWPPRPATAAWGVLFVSTNSITAPAPVDANLVAGDRWLRHPNAL